MHKRNLLVVYCQSEAIRLLLPITLLRPQPEKGFLSKKLTMKLTIDYYY